MSIEDVRLPNGVVVRIRAPHDADRSALERLHAAPGAVRIGTSEAGSVEAVLLADYAWGGRIVGDAAWRRRHGPLGAAEVTIARDFARTPLAAHLLVRLARLADAALVPTLVMEPPAFGALNGVLREAFGAEQAAGGRLEVPTREWPAALARLEHLRSVPGHRRAVAADGTRGRAA